MAKQLNIIKLGGLQVYYKIYQFWNFNDRSQYSYIK